MGLFSKFLGRTAPTDDLAYAHKVAAQAVGVFEDVVADLKHANEVLHEVKETAIAEIEVAKAWFENHVAHHTSKHDAANVAQAKNETVIQKIEALFS